MERVAQGPGRVLDGRAGGPDAVAEAEVAVDQAAVARELGGHTGAAQAFGVLVALVAQRVEAGGGDVGGGRRERSGASSGEARRSVMSSGPRR